MASKAKGFKSNRKEGARILTQKFDPRAQLIGGAPSVGGHKLDRGRLVHAETGKVIKFMYNPPFMSVEHKAAMHATNTEGWTDKDAEESGVEGGVLIDGIGYINVPLLFDRHYETWDSAHKNTIAGRYGVYADVLAFYDFLGITPERTKANPLSVFTVEGLPGEVWQSMFPESAMPPTDAYLHIGSRLKYFGRVESIGVSYTHFTHKMVPNRCVVTIGMKLLPSANARDSKQKHKPKGDTVKKKFDPKKGLR